jgi:phytoene dehydrogenase-like protein
MDIWTRWQPVVQKIVFTETYAVPVPMEEKRPLLEKLPDGREYLKYFDTTPGEFVLQHFEHPRVRAFIAFLGVMRGYELDAPQTGYLIPAMIAWGVNPQLCRGTSHALGDNPVETFIKLVGKENLEPKFAELATNFRFSKTTPIFAVNLALNERPKYIMEAKHPEVAGAFMHIVGLDEYQDLVNLFEDCRSGQLPRKPFMNGATPSYHDPTQAPPGKATAFMWQLMTYNLWGNPLNWDKARHEWFYKQLGVWQQFAPNLDENNILSTDSMTPLDIERHDRNMYCGDWMVGEYSGDQALENRPFPGWGQYRTPIEGLFMCGSSCHPGGNITGAPGYNAARVIAESLGIKPWWSPVDLTTHLEGLR